MRSRTGAWPHHANRTSISAAIKIAVTFRTAPVFVLFMLATMKNIRKFAVLTTVMLCALCGPASANQDELRLVGRVFVSVDDKVVDLCLPHPDALVDTAELILRRSGVTVTESIAMATHILNLGALGWARRVDGIDTGTCDTALVVSLFRYSIAPEGHTAKISAYGTTLLQSGYAKPEMQAQLRHSVAEAVTELANEILKARQVGE